MSSPSLLASSVDQRIVVGIVLLVLALVLQIGFFWAIRRAARSPVGEQQRYVKLAVFRLLPAELVCGVLGLALVFAGAADSWWVGAFVIAASLVLPGLTFLAWRRLKRSSVRYGSVRYGTVTYGAQDPQPETPPPPSPLDPPSSPKELE